MKEFKETMINEPVRIGAEGVYLARRQNRRSSSAKAGFCQRSEDTPNALRWTGAINQRFLKRFWAFIALFAIAFAICGCAPFLGGEGVKSAFRAADSEKVSYRRLDSGGVVKYGDKTMPLALPQTFSDLKSGETLTIDIPLERQPHENFLFLHHVYAPLRVYWNGELIYEYGWAKDLPSFLSDPPNNAAALPLPLPAGGALHFEYAAPQQRSGIIVRPPLVGNISGLMLDVFSAHGSNFFFALLLFAVAVILIVLSGLARWFGLPSRYYFWLGLFALSTAAWSLGECRVSPLFFPYPVFLYFMNFLGLFLLPVPLLFFYLSLVEFSDGGRRVRYAAKFILAAAASAVALQLGGIVDLSVSLFIFHLIIPAAFIFLTGCLAYEYAKQNNEQARRHLPSICVLLAAALLEVANYYLKLGMPISTCFLFGIFIFILINAVISSRFINEQRRLEQENAEIAMKLRLAAVELSSRQKIEANIRQTAEAISRQRHDLRHKLLLFSRRLEAGDYDGLKGLIAEAVADIPAASERYAENEAVNAIVAHYAGIAAESGIEFAARLAVPAQLVNLKDSELGMVFANLLENAVEANGRGGMAAHFIRISSRLQYGVLAIFMENSFDGAYRVKDGVAQSRKHNGAGIGLSSITIICQKHGGDAEFSADGETFRSSVYLEI